MTNEGKPIVGPRADERGPNLKVEDAVLAEGLPLYHVFLNPNAANVSADEAHEAKSRLAALIEADPDGVLACNGKTRTQARAALERIEETDAHVSL